MAGLNAVSLKRLSQVHPDLSRVILRAARDPSISFVVTEGLRDPERQRLLVKAGKSQTLKSRHLPHKKDGLSRAVDLAVIVNGKAVWDYPSYKRLAGIVKAAAKVEKVPIEWGGDWKSIVDGPHFQLPWASYP